MIQPPPAIPPPPILDLYGPTRPTMHRTGLAAIACWVAVAQNVVVAAVMIFNYAYSTLVVSWGVRSIITTNLFGELIAASLFVASVLAFVIADIARGQINPWPRRLMAVTGMLDLVDAAASFVIQWRRGPWGIRFLTRFEWAGLLSVTLSATTTIALGLIYALQIAGWTKSRSLAIASTLILGFSLLSSVNSIVITALLLYASHRSVPWLLRMMEIEFSWPMLVFGGLLAAALICYWTVLALKLRKMRAAA